MTFLQRFSALMLSCGFAYFIAVKYELHVFYALAIVSVVYLTYLGVTFFILWRK
jgi:hypothetical protein